MLGIYQSYVNQPTKFFAPSPKRSSKIREISKDKRKSLFPITITRFSNKNVVSHLTTTTNTGQLESFLRDNLRSASCHTQSKNQQSIFKTQDINPEFKINQPQIRLTRKIRDSANSSIESISEFYGYLKPKSLELEEKTMKKPANHYRIHSGHSRRVSLPQEIYDKKSDLSKTNSPGSETRAKSRSTHHGCISPGLFHSPIINNYLLEIQ